MGFNSGFKGLTLLPIAKIRESGWTIGGIILTEENRSTCRKQLSRCHFSRCISLTWLPGSEREPPWLTGWRPAPSDMARLSQNKSTCEKNQHGMAKPCPDDHITSVRHVIKIERGIFRTRLYKTLHIHSFLRFRERRNKLYLAEAVHIKLNVRNTKLHDLPKWSRHFCL